MCAGVAQDRDQARKTIRAIAGNDGKAQREARRSLPNRPPTWLCLAAKPVQHGIALALESGGVTAQSISRKRARESTTPAAPRDQHGWRSRKVRGQQRR